MMNIDFIIIGWLRFTYAYTHILLYAYKWTSYEPYKRKLASGKKFNEMIYSTVHIFHFFHDNSPSTLAYSALSSIFTFRGGDGGGGVCKTSKE